MPVVTGYVKGTCLLSISFLGMFLTKLGKGIISETFYDANDENNTPTCPSMDLVTEIEKTYKTISSQSEVEIPNAGLDHICYAFQ